MGCSHSDSICEGCYHDYAKNKKASVKAHCCWCFVLHFSIPSDILLGVNSLAFLVRANHSKSTK